MTIASIHSSSNSRNGFFMAKAHHICSHQIKFNQIISNYILTPIIDVFHFIKMEWAFSKLRLFYSEAVFYIVCVWAVIEIALCTAYYYSASEDHADNFLYGLCETWQTNEPICGGFIKKALVVRIITAAFLLLGNLTVRIFELNIFCWVISFLLEKEEHRKRINFIDYDILELHLVDHSMDFSQCNGHIPSDTHHCFVQSHMWVFRFKLKTSKRWKCGWQLKWY